MDLDQNKTQEEKKGDLKKRYQAILSRWKNLNTANPAFFRILPVIIILIALPLIVLLSLQQQELRQRAAITTSCNNGLTCGVCSATANTCSFGNGTQSCSYTTSLGGGACNPVSFPQVFCHVNNCSSGFTCSNQQCVSTAGPTATPTPKVPTPTSITGGGTGTCNTSVSPGQSLGSAMGKIGSGQTLCVHGGTYTENISTGVASGAKVVAYAGERPVVVGLMWLSSLSNVTIDGINVTWSSSNNSSQHMVKFSGGSGWIYQNSEVWGAHSFAGILISGGATNFKLQNMYVHDTYPSNDTNQDHLVYINDANGGIVERSLFINSANGRGIKLGPPSGGTAGPGGIIIRYNTFYNNLGPSNVQLSYGSHDNQVYRNIAQKSSQENITAYNLNGKGNTVHDNVGFDSSAVASSSFDTGGNLHIDPQLSNFHPQNSQAQSYGKYAP